MKVVVHAYNGVHKFNDVAGYTPTSELFAIIDTVDGKSVETIFPVREIERMVVFHTVNLAAEMEREAQAEAVRSQLTLPGM